MLTDMIAFAYPSLSYTQIENLLMRTQVASEEALQRESLTREYLIYIVDTLLAVITREDTSMTLQNIFVS